MLHVALTWKILLPPSPNILMSSNILADSDVIHYKYVYAFFLAKTIII